MSIVIVTVTVLRLRLHLFLLLTLVFCEERQRSTNNYTRHFFCGKKVRRLSIPWDAQFKGSPSFFNKNNFFKNSPH